MLLLFRRAKDRILCGFGDAELQNRLGGDLDFCARRGIAAEACLSLLLYKFAESWKCELAFLRLAVGQISQRGHEILYILLADASLGCHFGYDLGLRHFRHSESSFVRMRAAGCSQLSEP